MEKSSFQLFIIFPILLSNLYQRWYRKVYLLTLSLLILLALAVPAKAAVEGFVVQNNDGSYHQYNYNELIDSYGLYLLGQSNGLFEDFRGKKPVALFNTANGYIDYDDVLNSYALALLAGQPFNLDLYTAGSQVRQATMPIKLKLVTIKSGSLIRESISLGQGGDESINRKAPAESTNSDVGAAREEVKDTIVVTTTALVGASTVTLEQAQQWAAGKGAHQRFIDVAPLYWHYGSLTGIRPEALYAQAAYETGFGRFGGIVPAEYNNWAGIKVAASNGNEPEDHEQFATPDDGVRAHFNHIAAYAGLPPVGVPHGRYHVVARASWAGTVTTVEELSGIWAPSTNYHTRIVNFLAEMQTN